MEGLKRSAVAAVVFGLLMAGSLAAQEARVAEGITVQGNGSAKGKPTQVEIECTISGDAELAADATVKFRDAKKRALAAIEAMKNPDVKVTSEGVSINNTIDANTQMMIMRGMGGATPSKAHIQIVEKSHIVLSNANKLEPEALLDTVLKVLDVAKDAGFQVGPPSPRDYNELQMAQSAGNAMVTFKLPDGTSLRDQAYKSAIEDARGKAEKLAELAGVKLGRVLAIQEASGPNRGDASVASTSAGELTKRINLTVQFEIVK